MHLCPAPRPAPRPAALRLKAPSGGSAAGAPAPRDDQLLCCPRPIWYCRQLHGVLTWLASTVPSGGALASPPIALRAPSLVAAQRCGAVGLAERRAGALVRRSASGGPGRRRQCWSQRPQGLGSTAAALDWAMWLAGALGSCSVPSVTQLHSLCRHSHAGFRWRHGPEPRQTRCVSPLDLQSLVWHRSGTLASAPLLVYPLSNRHASATG
ncbi:hypothetical protein TgHK011_000292 [Trichoderma gracile]|nr:hypothetical protein TgHK011_000292 [Trichoderma gracile]